MILIEVGALSLKKVTPKWVLLCIPTAAPKKPIKTISNSEACSTHVGVAFKTYLPYTSQLNITVIVTSAKPVSTSQKKAILSRECINILINCEDFFWIISALLIYINYWP